MEPKLPNMINHLWWMVLVRGLVTLAFGITALFWPGLTVLGLVYLFSVWVLVSGIMNLFFGVSSITQAGLWWLRLIWGILEVGVGIYIVRNPLLSLTLLLLILGFTFLFQGLLEVVAAFMEPSDVAGRGLLVIMGILSAILGVVILRQPVEGGLAFIWALGAFAVVSGTIQVARAAQAKTLLDRTSRPARI